MPWSNLSDGTKRIFYLLFEVARIKSGIVLVDEPELGIHPHQFFQLMLFLKEEAQQKQIIMATHAPQTLDFISPEELNCIFVASYDKKLGTQIRPLTEEQKEKARQYMKEEFLRDYWLASDLEV
jgi:predicted ATPase